MKLRTLTWWPPVTCALFFFAIGWPFLRYPGLHNDELIFAGPVAWHSGSIFDLGPSGHRVPLMLLSYCGALKTWLYAPLLHYSVSYLSIRVPVLLTGSLCVGLAFLLVERLHSRRAAWIAGLLLATDAVFLLTDSFDWGPVALQHLFLLLSLLLVLRFWEAGSLVALGWGFFVFGLAMWDKALFIWVFSGIILAVVAVYPRQVWSRLTRQNLAVATLAFCLGSLPLIAYNATTGMDTYRSSSGRVWNEFSHKFAALRATWDGSALFGYLVNAGEAAAPRSAKSALEQGSFRVHSAFGDRYRNWTEPALLFALLLLPGLWFTGARRILVFCLIASAVAWFEMAITRGAGGAAHHAILLWPMPQIFLAVAFAEASRFARRFGPWLISAVILCLASGNLLVLNQYFYDMYRNGPKGGWTDAINSLSERIGKIPASRIMVVDWGILNPLALMHRGGLPLVWAGDPYFDPHASEAERKYKISVLSDRDTLWISHTDGNELFPGVNGRLLAVIQAAGYDKQFVATFSDRNGRPIFEAFRVVPRVPAP